MHWHEVDGSKIDIVADSLKMVSERVPAHGDNHSTDRIDDALFLITLYEGSRVRHSFNNTNDVSTHYTGVLGAGARHLRHPL